MKHKNNFLNIALHCIIIGFGFNSVSFASQSKSDEADINFIKEPHASFLKMLKELYDLKFNSKDFSEKALKKNPTEPFRKILHEIVNKNFDDKEIRHILSSFYSQAKIDPNMFFNYRLSMDEFIDLNIKRIKNIKRKIEEEKEQAKEEEKKRKRFERLGNQSN